jgi:hypothetical protein
MTTMITPESPFNTSQVSEPSFTIGHSSVLSPALLSSSFPVVQPAFSPLGSFGMKQKAEHEWKSMGELWEEGHKCFEGS